MTASQTRMVKVCKIDSITFASFAIKNDVDFLGVHVLENENIGAHQELIDFIKSGNGKPILVTKIQSIEGLIELIELYKPSGIQFHYEMQPQLGLKIRQLYPNLILFGVLTDNSSFLDFSSINQVYDFVIYDTSYVGGTNEQNTYRHLGSFPDELREKTFLAGGISLERIKELNPLKTGGYDIQSYFRVNGELNFQKLDRVCDLLKPARTNKISVSLTDLSLINIHQAASYHLYPNLEYHLDSSSGSLYSSFDTRNLSIEVKQQFMSQLPYSIHLFSNSEEEIRRKIERLSKKYPLSLTRIFVQYFEGLTSEIFSDTFHDIKIIPSVFYRDLELFLSKTIKTNTLSIVVPRPEEKQNIESFIEVFLRYHEFFKEREIWFDRNLELEYIQILKTRLEVDFNVIVGKGVTNDWSKLDRIHECLLKQQ